MVEFILLAFLLGLKHSFDVDHIVAVSSLLSKSKSLKSSIKLGGSWAMGHMVTATLLTFLLFINKDSILPVILDKFDFIVGAMLLFVGIYGVYEGYTFHLHRKQLKNQTKILVHVDMPKEHSHRRMFGIGIIHGLASNDELLVLLTASLGAASFLELLVGLSFFTIGVVAGMVLFATVFTYPILKIDSDRIRLGIMVLLGTLSAAYGGYLLVMG